MASIATATAKQVSDPIGGEGVVTVRAQALADAGTALVAGEVFILVPKGEDQPGLYSARDTADSGVYHSGVLFGVALEAIADEAYGSFGVQGQMEVLCEGDNTAIAIGTGLVSTIAADSGGERALHPTAQMGSASGAVVVRKVIGQALEAYTGAGANITVDFDGRGGFGMHMDETVA